MDGCSGRKIKVSAVVNLNIKTVYGMYFFYIQKYKETNNSDYISVSGEQCKADATECAFFSVVLHNTTS